MNRQLANSVDVQSIGLRAGKRNMPAVTYRDVTDS